MNLSQSIRNFIQGDHVCVGNIEACSKAGQDECTVCGARDCPGGEPLHYHHDGCPACCCPPSVIKSNDNTISLTPCPRCHGDINMGWEREYGICFDCYWKEREGQKSPYPCKECGGAMSMPDERDLHMCALCHLKTGM